jgi:hypothetical protein
MLARFVHVSLNHFRANRWLSWGGRMALMVLMLGMGPPTSVAAATPLALAPPHVRGATHRRQRDTLALALRYGVTWQSIVAANNIVNPNLIYVTQVLCIPVARAGRSSPQR